ncbi:MAG: Trm112 family protein [Metallibacterium sp.]
MDSRLLDILVCPLSKTPLRPLTRAELDALNRAIAAGQVHSVTGAALEAPLREGLITRDGKLVYRVDDGIPVLLGDEGIGTTQLNDFPR